MWEVNNMALLRIKLVDADTGAPIPFVTVGIGGYTVVTDTNGVAEVDLPPGTYIVHAKPPFYRPLRETVTCPGEYTFRLKSLLL